MHLWGDTVGWHWPSTGLAEPVAHFCGGRCPTYGTGFASVKNPAHGTGRASATLLGCVPPQMHGAYGAEGTGETETGAKNGGFAEHF